MSPDRAILILLALGFSIAVSFTRPFTDGADAVTALALVAMLLAQVVNARSGKIASMLGDSRSPRPTLRSCLPWIGVTGVVLAFELFNYFSSPREAHPTLSSLSDELSSSHVGKAALGLAWLALGALLLKGPSAPREGAGG